MFNVPVATKGLSFFKILGGLSKTLQVANQLIPVYQKAKPAISNARTILSVFKEFNRTPSAKNNQAKIIDAPPEEVKIKESATNQTAPTFFL